MSLELISKKCALLRDRAALLAQMRAFFAERKILEVDCPILSRAASIDVHIDLIEANCEGERCYLHSSPEYGMKRLLSLGIGDIYQLSHVFRDHENGAKHNPEFLMAEWYRMDVSFDEMMDETIAFVRLFLPLKEKEVFSYRDALEHFAGIDYLTVETGELLHFLKEKGITTFEKDRDELLNLVFGLFVEPFLGVSSIALVKDFPASRAALAKTYWKGDEEVAERFELFYRGMELANGYHELTDPVEQRRRLSEANARRKSFGKKELPIDKAFLEALEAGIPDCCGVAVGADRLFMLRHDCERIQEILPL